MSAWISPVSLTNARQSATLVDKSGPGTNTGKEYRLELYYEPNKMTSDVRFSLGKGKDGSSWSVVWSTYVSIPSAPAWTHVAVVWDSTANDGNGHLGLYVNGIMVASRTVVGPTTSIATIPSILHPGEGDLLVGASRVDSLTNQQIVGAQAPTLASSDVQSVRHGKLMSLYEEYRLELYYEPNKMTSDVRFSLGKGKDGSSWSVVWSTYVSIPSAPAWTHVAVVWDSTANDGNGHLGLYVNGIMVASRTVVGPTTSIATIPSILHPGEGDLLVGASRVDSLTNQQIVGAQAPTLASSDVQSVRHGKLMSLYEGQIDELRIWHIALSSSSLAGVRPYHRLSSSSGRKELCSDVTGLAGQWSFDEGYGTYSSNTCGDQRGSRYGALTLMGGGVNKNTVDLGRPTFVVSLASIGDQVEIMEDKDVTIQLNSSDAAGRQVLYVITSLPSVGTLYEGTVLGLSF